MILIIILQGCEAPSGQVESLRPNYSTEQLREWKRQSPEKKKLLVFVHGFNSSRQTAWGSFPDLILSDQDFADYNVHLFGYPSRICGQTSDIQDQGEFLASLLKDTLPRYDSTILIAHSMGGLVALHALVALERSNYDLMKDADVKILTFGTPYMGVPGANLLPLLCSNTQANDVQALGKALGRLQQEWKQRFNRQAAPGERETLQVPLYAFRAATDDFVPEASACAGASLSCEVVDGNHLSIVKPLTRDNLAYIKVKAIARAATVPQVLGGYVRNATGNPVADVRVSLPQFGLTATTDQFGHFAFQVQASKEQSVDLLAQKPGYKTYDTYATLGNTSLSFTLQRK
jgi:hypothetical protein